jgi:hypothetical protein
MRFIRNDPVVFRLTTRDGSTIPFFIDSDINKLANPDKQCLATFTVTPYIRDGDYMNHVTEPIPAT